MLLYRPQPAIVLFRFGVLVFLAISIIEANPTEFRQYRYLASYIDTLKIDLCERFPLLRTHTLALFN